MIGIALAGLTALGAAACAPAPQWLIPIPPDIRAQMSRVGILGPPPPKFAYAKPPTPGAGWGYLRGVGLCFDGAFKSGGGEGAPFVILGAIVGCPTIGGLAGAVQNPSDTEVEDARAALERLGGDGALSDALRDDVVALLTRDAPQYAVELLAAAASDGPPLETSADTVVALENLSVALLQCDGDQHIAPPLALYAVLDA